MHKNYFLVSLALMLLTACGASVSQGPANDRGLIDMNRELSALPTGGPSPYGSAYGAHQGDRTTLASVDIDRYLKPEARAAKRAKPASVAAKQEAPVLAKAAPQPQPAPEQLAVAQVTAPPADDDAQRYAAREQQPKSQALENYKAGDAIVITSGALIIILLVVILVLLLT